MCVIHCVITPPALRSLLGKLRFNQTLLVYSRVCVQAILESMQALPGVDVNNPEVQRAINDATEAVDKGDDKAGDKPEDKPDES